MITGEYNLVVLKVGHTYPRRRLKSTYGEGLSYRARVPKYGRGKKKRGSVDNEKVECSVVNRRLWELGRKKKGRKRWLRWLSPKASLPLVLNCQRLFYNPRIRAPHRAEENAGRRSWVTFFLLSLTRILYYYIVKTWE